MSETSFPPANVAAPAFHIWVDADACPVVIKDILFRAAERTGVPVTLVANQSIRTPSIPHVRSLQVSSGFDVADNEIVKRVRAGDLVITSDIPLAAEVIAKGALALSPRGELLTEGNVRPRLNMRDFLDTMRASGVHTGGPPPLSQRDRQAFANHLDTIITRATANKA
ncbi:MAG: YaiI/YqxD family protein [Pseudohongiellaceae bacterium]